MDIRLQITRPMMTSIPWVTIDVNNASTDDVVSVMPIIQTAAEAILTAAQPARDSVSPSKSTTKRAVVDRPQA
jgi:hypothetical protein